MIPQGVHQVKPSVWIDTREMSDDFEVITPETEMVRPTLLPYEKRIPEYDKIRCILNLPRKVILLVSENTKLPKDILKHQYSIVRRYSDDRICRQIPRRVNIWIQWFPHSHKQRANEIKKSFEENCKIADTVYQMSEADYSADKYPFLYKDNVTIVPTKDRISYNVFFDKVNATIRSSSSNPTDIHILMNADMEWTREASLGLEYCLWESGKYAISPLRWEDHSTMFAVRSDSQDVWGFEARALPEASKMKMPIPLGKPGCDNRILMELLIQGFQTLNHPLQFPTIHNHKSMQRNYTPRDQIPKPYLFVRPQWHIPCESLKNEGSVIMKNAYSLCNHTTPLLSGSEISEKIRKNIESRTPFAIGKTGTLETEAIIAFQQRLFQTRQLFGVNQIMYPPSMSQQLFINAGVYPIQTHDIDTFVRLYQHSLSSFDVLCASFSDMIPEWGEYLTITRGSKKNITSCRKSSLEPFFQVSPYTKAFAKRRVTVISPFVDTFRGQLKKRDNIWGERAKDLLPDNVQWRFIKAPLPMKPVDTNWQTMVERLTVECFPESESSMWPDIVLCGFGPGGAYLCAEAKLRGRVGIDMGGSLQLLFGVRGKRWDSDIRFKDIYNEHWVRPSREETPPQNSRVKNGAYW